MLGQDLAAVWIFFDKGSGLENRAGHMKAERESANSAE